MHTESAEASWPECIPRVLYVTWRTGAYVPRDVTHCLHVMYPEFEVRALNDVDIETELRTCFGARHADFFCKIPPGPIRSDFWRACVLAERGGLYVDVDLDHMAPLERVASPCASLIVSGSRDGARVNPVYLAAAPGHAVLRRCVDMMLELAHTPFDYWAWSICTNLHAALRAEGVVPANCDRLACMPDGSLVQFLTEDQFGFSGFRGRCTSYGGVRLAMNKRADYDRGFVRSDTAVIVTGQLRGARSGLERLRRALAGAHVYVATYERYRLQALQIGGVFARAVFVDGDVVNDAIPASGAKQWVLLQRLLDTFDLSGYRTIVRMRSDAILPRDFRLPTETTPGVMHVMSDNFFYSDAGPLPADAPGRVRRLRRAGCHRRIPEDRMVYPHWEHLQRSTFDDRRVKHPTRWYLLYYPTWFADVVDYPCDWRGMLRALACCPEVRHHFGAAALRDARQLARVSQARSGFDSEVSFLMLCLEHGPVAATACGAIDSP